MPTVRALDHPAPRRMVGRRPRTERCGLATAPPAGRMHEVATRLSGLVGLGIVEALIPTQVLRMSAGRGRPRDYHAVQDSVGQLHGGAVRGAEHEAQRRPASVVEHMPFGAQFAPIGRVRACRGAAAGGKAPSRYRWPANPSQYGGPHRSAVTEPPRAGPTLPAASIPGSGRARSSPSQTPAGRPSTGSRCGARAGYRPARAGTARRGARGCRAASPGAAARGSPPREGRASARSSARPWHHSDSPCGTSSQRGASAHLVPFFG